MRCQIACEEVSEKKFPIMPFFINKLNSPPQLPKQILGRALIRALLLARRNFIANANTLLNSHPGSLADGIKSAQEQAYHW